MKKSSTRDTDFMEDDQIPETLDLEDDEEEIIGVSNSDLCEKLMERYGKSSATQHRHLCASAAAMKTILQEEDLPLTPISYFAATISAINDSLSTNNTSLDLNAISALSSFLSILLPLIPSKSLPTLKAKDAVFVLVSLLQAPKESISTATIRSVIKSLGILLRFCDLEDWSVVKLPFETILSFSIDKRPKVRKSAQLCIEDAFKSFKCSIVTKEASKVFLTLFNSYMPSAINLIGSPIVAGSKGEMVSNPEHLEVVHMLNVLKLIIPFISTKISLTIISEIHKLLSPQYSLLTRHNLAILEAFFESSRADAIITVPVAEKILVSLASYVSSGGKNPIDTVLSASILLKSCLVKLQFTDRSTSIRNLPLVFSSISGLLVSDNTSAQAADILKDLINHHIDKRVFNEDNFMSSAESTAVESICAAMNNMLSSCRGDLKEHLLAVIGDLFLKLGDFSYLYLKEVVQQLAEVVIHENGDLIKTKHVQECIGAAVTAMGPQKLLMLIPVSLNAEDLTCSNTWVLPILKKYIVGASLEYFMEHIVPLAESLQKASKKVKKSQMKKTLQAAVCGLWDLLPAFCHYPTDTDKRFGSLAELLIVVLKNKSSTHESISVALQLLVNENRNLVLSDRNIDGSANNSTATTDNEEPTISRDVPSPYTKKIASRNIKALASCSVGLLQAFTDIFFISSQEKRSYLKEAIQSLASVTEISEVKKIFISLLEKFQSKNEKGEPKNENGDAKNEKGEAKNDLGESKNEKGESKNKEGKSDIDDREAQRCTIIEFTSALVRGGNEEFVNIIFDYIKPALQDEGLVQYRAYQTLGRIFEEHSWFHSSRFDEIMGLLLGLKMPIDTMSLRSRFACFQILLVHILKSDSMKNNGKAFLLLNEIILTLKDSNEEVRKVAYDALIKISCSLKNISSDNADSPYQKLLNMIMGYLSGTSPSIMSGAVAALSLLIYKEKDICVSVPELVPSVLALLQGKAKEVIKVVLGFVKVLVSSLPASDLQGLLADIVHGITPWSSSSRNHFRSKVTVILEILIRKCGFSSVELVVPEKYKRFINSVKEQRHGKTTEDSDMVPAPEGGNKRTYKELSTPNEGPETTATRKERRAKRFKELSTPNEGHSNGNDSHFFQKTERFPKKKVDGNQFDRSGKQRDNKRDFNKSRTSNEKTGGWKSGSRPSFKRPASTSRFDRNKKTSQPTKVK